MVFDRGVKPSTVFFYLFFINLFIILFKFCSPFSVLADRGCQPKLFKANKPGKKSKGNENKLKRVSVLVILDHVV